MVVVKKIKSILLVDDDPIANYLHFNLVESLDIAENIEIVTNGEEALDFISKKGLPEIILLDIHMPVMDGILFLKKFRTLCPSKDCKIFVLTSSEHENDIADCALWGIDGYMIKPLTEAKICKLLNPYCKTTEAETDLQV